jgi:hypothetical protein
MDLGLGDVLPSDLDLRGTQLAAPDLAGFAPDGMPPYRGSFLALVLDFTERSE